MKPISSFSSADQEALCRLNKLAASNYVLNEDAIEQIMRGLKIIAFSQTSALPFALHARLELQSTGARVVRLAGQLTLSYLDISDCPDIHVLNDFVPAQLNELKCTGDSARTLSLQKSNVTILDASGNKQLSLKLGALPRYLSELVLCGDALKLLNIAEHRNLRQLDISNNSGLRLQRNLLAATVVCLRASGDSCKCIDCGPARTIREIVIADNADCQLLNVNTAFLDVLDASGDSCSELDLSLVKSARQLVFSRNKRLKRISLPAKTESADFTYCSKARAEYSAKRPKEILGGENVELVEVQAAPKSLFSRERKTKSNDNIEISGTENLFTSHK